MDVSIKELKYNFDVNFFGPVITLQQAAPFIKKRGGGSVVIMQSNAAYISKASPFAQVGLASSYIASKTAAASISRIAAGLSKSHNISVYGLGPTVYLTEMNIEGTKKMGITPQVFAEDNNWVFRGVAADPVAIAKVLEHFFEGTSKYPAGSNILVEHEYTLDSQVLYNFIERDELPTPSSLIPQLNLLNGDPAYLTEEKVEKTIREYKNSLKRDEL